MAFKKLSVKKNSDKDIESLFRDLNSKIQSLYSHQSDILRHYQLNTKKEKDIAIELPTGSGKTLVGLLIAEHYRVTKQRRALYLCPTRQLVNQVVELANTEYGINAIGFTGSNKKYTQIDKHKYRNAESIAVASYSSLFNSYPWFTEPGIIIIDDAHTAENYISANWSLEITRSTSNAVYRSVVDVLKSSLDYSIYNRLMSDTIDYGDRNRIEKLPNTVLYKFKDQLFEVLSDLLNDDDNLKHNWSVIKHNLHACQIFLSWSSLLIRPLIPPSLNNLGFSGADKRVYMSATLGAGGDLQRITGVSKFYKIPIPEGWDKQGNGRRFFMFPDLSLELKEKETLVSELLKRNARSVVLVSSDEQVQTQKSEIELLHPEIEFFTARDIEKSKSAFIESDKAAIVMANRFDGIDFAGDQSRMLFLHGIPYASNLQEKFFQSRMNASIIFNDRNRTRLVQAIGRCTRSPKDFSAICVLGEKDLSEWLVLQNKYKYFHPELQAELMFGAQNSTNEDVSVDSFLENFDEFIKQSEIWQEANQSIIEGRDEAEQEEFEGSEQLLKTAPLEVDFQYKLWNKRYLECYNICNEILNNLQGGQSLMGYKAYWNYQAGCVADVLFQETGDEIYLNKKSEYFENLVRLCPSATWARQMVDKLNFELELDEGLIYNIENLQSYIASIKITSVKKYRNYLDNILFAIDKNDLEYVNEHIGLLLGFKAFNPDNQGAPDPIWNSNNRIVYVFEDKFHQNIENKIKIEDIRQALGHVEWVKANIDSLDENTEIIPVMITNRLYTDQPGADISGELLYWNCDDFLTFAKEIVSLARIFPNYYGGEDDSHWREFFAEEYYKKQIGPNQIKNRMKKMKDLVKV